MKKIVIVLFVLFPLLAFGQGKRIGVIGLDTSHAPAFIKLINDTTGAHPELAGWQVTAAYPYGSQSIASSYERIPGYIEQVKQYGVEIVASVEDLLNRVDYVLLETNDGNLHLEQAYAVFKSGKPVFIDKPVAASLSDAIAIYELARRYKVPCFSSSSLRYTEETQQLASGASGRVIGTDSFSPATPEPSHPDFSWYGIHGVETLFTVMGTGCTQVTRVSSLGNDLVVGLWDDGRIGTFRGNVEAKSGYGGFAFTEKGVRPLGSKVPYDALVKVIVRFFETGVVPVTEQETLEIFTFMEASNESKRRNGMPVLTAEVFEKNKREALRKIEKLR